MVGAQSMDHLVKQCSQHRLQWKAVGALMARTSKVFPVSRDPTIKMLWTKDHTLFSLRWLKDAATRKPLADIWSQSRAHSCKA